jgi:hypothetical protein
VDRQECTYAVTQGQGVQWREGGRSHMPCRGVCGARTGGGCGERDGPGGGRGVGVQNLEASGGMGGAVHRQGNEGHQGRGD